MRKIKDIKTDYDLQQGFAWITFLHDDEELSLQACLKERKECSDDERRYALVKSGADIFKKEISESDPGFDWGICEDGNKKAFDIFGKDECWNLFKREIKKAGVRIK